eukprot:Pgem_evm1s8678
MDLYGIDLVLFIVYFMMTKQLKTTIYECTKWRVGAEGLVAKASRFTVHLVIVHRHRT